MNMHSTRSIRRLLALLLMLAAMFTADTARAHGDEDHGAAEPAQTVTPAAQGAMLTSHGSTTLFELLVKYPATATGEDTRVRFFLADFATNRPLEGAQFKLAFKPEGVELAGAPMMVSPGVYDLVARFPTDAVYSMVATVSAGGRTDFVEVKNIYAGEAAETFLAEHGGPGVAGQSEAGRPVWQLALMGLGGLLVVVVAARALLRRGSRSRQQAPAASIPRDSELTVTGVTASMGGASGTTSSATPAQTQGSQTT